MRIISGKHKGRRITAPKKLPIRPTTDMAKESLFNILNNLYYFDDISVLDLFSGSGNISYEFASRGTERITSVDANFGCIKFINETAEDFEMSIQTIKSDVFKFLEKATSKSTIIFADPPYDYPVEKFAKIPELVFQNHGSGSWFRFRKRSRPYLARKPRKAKWTRSLLDASTRRSVLFRRRRT